MGRSGYTSLSISQKEYSKLRRAFDSTIDTDQTFTVWAMSVLESAIIRERKLKSLFPGLKFVGKTSNGVIIQDKKEIIEVKNNLTCKVDNGLCDHILFCCIHPEFMT